MTQDKDIQELFDSVNVPLADADVFLETLNQRLEKVEYIKEAQDIQIKRYKASVIYSLIAGIIVGAGSMVLLPSIKATVIEKMASTLAATSMIEIDNPIATVNMGIALIAGITAFLIVWNVQGIRGILDRDTSTVKL